MRLTRRHSRVEASKNCYSWINSEQSWFPYGAQRSVQSQERVVPQEKRPAQIAYQHEQWKFIECSFFSHRRATNGCLYSGATRVSGFPALELPDWRSLLNWSGRWMTSSPTRKTLMRELIFVFQREAGYRSVGNILEQAGYSVWTFATVTALD